MKWWNKEENKVEPEVKIEQPKGVEFKSDNLSTKLPYDIYIDGEKTGHTIRYGDKEWYLDLDLYHQMMIGLNVEMFYKIKYCELLKIVDKIHQLNGELSCGK